MENRFRKWPGWPCRFGDSRGRRESLSSRHCAFAEGFGYQLPFVFVDYVAGLVCSDFFYVDAVAFEDMDHLPNAGDVLGGAGQDREGGEQLW